jgi:hypothetical protein
MNKKIKLTEKQIKMLKEKYESKPNKVLRITEQQFDRLFPENNEGGVPSLEDFAEEVVKFLKELTINQSDARTSEFWTSIGATRMKLIKWFKDSDIIALVPGQEDDEYKVRKKGLIGKIKELYEDFEFRYDTKEGEIDWEKEAITQESFGDDFELEETTTAGGVGGSYVAPMGHQGPIKRDLAPHKELNEEDLDETTMSGSATGSYEQPQIWAKDKKNWRHGKDTMYPDGKIVENQKGVNKSNMNSTAYPGGEMVDFDSCTKLNNNKVAQNGGCSQGAVDGVVKTRKTANSVVSEALILKRSIINNKRKRIKDLPALVVVSDLEGKGAIKDTMSNRKTLNQAGFDWNGQVWYIEEDRLEDAKKVLSLINKKEYVVNAIEEIEEMVLQAKEGKESKKDIMLGNLEQYLDDLANATDAKAMSAEIRRYLTFFAKFHQYSHFNRILIYLQRPDATRVAGMKTWNERGRKVKPNSKSIGILKPIFGNEDRNDNEDFDDILAPLVKRTTNRPSYYITVNVFDISDTVATSEDGEVPTTPQWHSGNEPSELADELYTYCEEFAKTIGIKITQSDSKRGEKGYSAGGHINLSSDIEGVGKLSTLTHEIAHELMHQRDLSPFYVGDEARGDAKLLELQAESVSYIILQHYGLPANHHPTYLALWGANKEKIRESMKIITDVAHYIIKHMEIMGKKDYGIEEGMVKTILDEMFKTLG